MIASNITKIACIGAGYVGGPTTLIHSGLLPGMIPTRTSYRYMNPDWRKWLPKPEDVIFSFRPMLKEPFAKPK